MQHIRNSLSISPTLTLFLVLRTFGKEDASISDRPPSSLRELDDRTFTIQEQKALRGRDFNTTWVCRLAIVRNLRADL
jgi:hypothetical protein